MDLLRPRFDYSNDQVAFTPCALHYREMHFYFIFITEKYYSFHLMYKWFIEESKHLICGLAIKDYCIKKDNH